MVSELDIEWGASEDVGLLRGGWIMRSHIGWRRERSIRYKGVETLRESPKRKTQKGQYLLAVGLGVTVFFFSMVHRGKDDIVLLCFN